MYIPKHHHWAFPVIVVAIGFYIHNHNHNSWDVILFVQMPLAVISSTWALYLWQAGVLYQKYVTQLDIRYGDHELRTDENSTQANDEFPPVKINGYTSFEAATKPPKLNREQKVANILLHQRNHNFDVNLKEEYWIKGKRFDGSRVEFVAMIDKWVGWQAIERAAARKNSPYVVRDWRVIELIAAGEYLPPPPQPVSLVRALQGKASE